MRSLQLLLILIFSAGAPLLAQSVSEAPEPEIRARLTGIALGKPVRGLYYLNGSKYQQVNFYPGTRSAKINYAGLKTFTLFKKTEIAGAEVAPYTPVASTLLNGNASDYLLFVSNGSKGNALNLMAIPEDMSNFNAGDYRFINLSKKTLALKMGDMKPALIKPMNFADISPKTFKQGTSYHTKMVDLSNKDTGHKLVYSSGISYNEDTRMLYLISFLPNGRVKLTAVPQVL